MTQAIATPMRVAFEHATRDCPKNSRTRLYAMVRSALNRKVGLGFRKSMWSVSRGAR